MGTATELVHLPAIPAADVRARLLRPSNTGTGTEAVCLGPAVIEGDLDLKHCQITRPVEFHDCHFLGRVDLRYSEFLQTVDFSNCVFHGTVNSGDKQHTRTIYRKDLICANAAFHGVVSFNRAYVEGNVSFTGSHFLRLAESLDGAKPLEDTEGEADFAGMQIERNFICNGAVFDRGVSFNALRCRTGEFHGTRFQRDGAPVDFRSAYFTGNIEFFDWNVRRRYIEDHDRVPRRLEHGPGPVVRGELDLRGFKCERRAIFTGVEFAGKVDCEDAVFGWYLDCRATCFKNEAIFTRARCDGAGLFQDASFEHDQKRKLAADFRYASFKSLAFSRAIFRGRAALGQTRIEEKLRLDETWFDDEVLLYGARIGTIVLLNEGFGPEHVLPQAGNQEKDESKTPRPHDACDAATRRLHEKRLCRLQTLRDTFQDMGACDPSNRMEALTRLDQRLRCDRRLLLQTTDYFLPFRDKKQPLGERGPWAAVGWWIWNLGGRTEPEPDPRGVEVNGCAFQRVHAGPMASLADELIRAFAASQKEERFSRDVYLQLEQFYKSTGNDERARDMHLWGHLATRHNALVAEGSVKWSRAQRMKDFVLMLTGWGLQAWRIWLLSLLIMFLGTMYFATVDGALRARDEPRAMIRGDVPGIGMVTLEQFTQTAEGQSDQVINGSRDLNDCVGERWDCLLRRAGYSATAYVPAVELGIDQGWEPANGFSEMVRLLLVIAGWLLIPLGVGSITGFIRSE